MNILITITTAIAVGAITAAIVVAAMRRSAQPAAADPTNDLRELQHRVGGIEGQLREGFARASQDTDSVRTVLDMLTQNVGTRGTWGEVTLRRLLERAGLAHLIDFDTQHRLPNGSRPDVLIDLGSNGKVVVDAKAPLDDLRAATEADDEAGRTVAIKRHVTAVRRHAGELAKRDYGSLLGSTFTPVVMYLPVDGAWESAISQSPDLPGDLVRLGIHPASPSTLGLVLEVLKQHVLSANRHEAMLDILADTKKLLESLGKHTEHLGKMGRALDGAVRAYNEGVGNLATRVVPATDRMANHMSLTSLSPPAEVMSTPTTARVPQIGPSAERVA